MLRKLLWVALILLSCSSAHAQSTNAKIKTLLGTWTASLPLVLALDSIKSTEGAGVCPVTAQEQGPLAVTFTIKNRKVNKKYKGGKGLKLVDQEGHVYNSTNLALRGDGYSRVVEEFFYPAKTEEKIGVGATRIYEVYNFRKIDGVTIGYMYVTRRVSYAKGVLAPQKVTCRYYYAGDGQRQ